VVTIDDYFPCFPNGGPMFASNHGSELWVMLLEKAYAKLHGDYYQLSNGFLAHGMADLTGCPVINKKFPKERKNFDAIETYADTLWDELEDADISNYIM
jgi:hypothetical protein